MGRYHFNVPVVPVQQCRRQAWPSHARVRVASSAKRRPEVGPGHLTGGTTSCLARQAFGSFLLVKNSFKLSETPARWPTEGGKPRPSAGARSELPAAWRPPSDCYSEGERVGSRLRRLEGGRGLEDSRGRRAVGPSAHRAAEGGWVRQGPDLKSATGMPSAASGPAGSLRGPKAGGGDIRGGYAGQCAGVSEVGDGASTAAAPQSAHAASRLQEAAQIQGPAREDAAVRVVHASGPDGRRTSAGSHWFHGAWPPPGRAPGPLPQGRQQERVSQWRRAPPGS